MTHDVTPEADDSAGGPQRLVIDGCAVATADPSGTEHARGHVVVEGDRIAAVGDGPGPRLPGARRTDGSGCLLTPGLVNTHHHLYQWATRGLVQQGTLFEWLSALYPVWARLDAESVRPAARAALAVLLTSGCSTSTDHQYLFPRGGGDLLAATIEAASALGIRFHPCRGSMDLGESSGGLPPDSVVEGTDEALAATEEAITRFHDPSPGSMLRVAVAPCSPFTASGELMRESATLARRHGVRLHTHLAETADEEDYCREQFGARPLDYAERLGWLGDDVWLAHGVHLSDADAQRLGRNGTGVAHCPSSNARLGAGIAPVPALLAANVPVGIGVDGAASNESGRLGPEMRQATLAARVRRDASRPADSEHAASSAGFVDAAGPADPADAGTRPRRGGDPAAMTARQALSLATIGGARCLGRADELGSLEPGKLADLALWRVDGPDHADIADPVAALVLGATPVADTVIVGGRIVVGGGTLRTGSPTEIAAEARAASRLLQEGGVSLGRGGQR